MDQSGGPTGASPEPAPPEAAAAPLAASVPRARSRPARVALAAVAAVLVCATAWHLTAVFLQVAPPNSVSRRYQAEIYGHVSPEFVQDWQFFAPVPLHVNIAVEARVRTSAGGASSVVSAWTDLTAQDLAHILHDPAPSHADQSMLLTAWNVEQRNTSPGLERLYTEYLKRIALQRLGRGRPGRRIVGIQLRAADAPITLPSDTGAVTRVQPSYVTLPWWSVTDADYQGLL